MRMRFGLLYLLPLLLLAPAPAGAEQARHVPLFDFDRSGVAGEWKRGEAAAELRWEQPPMAAPAGGPAGKALRIDAEARAQVSAALPQLKLAELERVQFWAFAESGEQVVLRLAEEDGRAAFWRRVDLKPGEWQRVDVPLRYMRRSDGRSPQWEKVRSLALSFRGKGVLWVDEVSAAGGPGAQTEFSDEELQSLALPAGGRKWGSAHALLLSNHEALDGEALHERLEQLRRRLEKDLPFAGPAGAGRPILIVFDTPEQYADFPLRLAKLLNATGAAPKSGGYTVHGIATASWLEEYGTMRPVFFHEFVHSWLDRVACMPSSSGDWLQEGLATHYQLEFQPQADLPRLIRAGLSDAARRLPLEELCSGKAVPLNRYWQAMTVAAMFLHEPAYRQRLPALWSAMLQRGSTDLGPHLEQLGCSWKELTRDWMQFCRRHYLGEAP